ncbi:MAG: 3-oxoacyl-ACP synthase III family protein [Bacteroidetes bacterium]|nr:3-oxoacyl-ACP synthase III family protein [Bacteroidota bacterium]
MNITNVMITGTGSYVPNRVVTNQDFAKNLFFDEGGKAFETSHEEIAEKFKMITGIEERRYVDDNLMASDIGTIAARLAIEDAGIDMETIDQIIVAHNFGDVKSKTIQTDILPSLASRIKHELGIKNPACVAYDVLFGCPGWIQGIIQATAFIRAGMAKKCLVIATETLSRVLDMHDRDSMIFADGSGACIIEAVETEKQEGIIGMEAGTWTEEEAYFLFLGKSNSLDEDPSIRYIKMNGRKIYEFAITKVPVAMKSCLDKAGADIRDVKKIIIHQANEKLDREIIKRLFRLYDEKDIPEGIMPMSIHKLGNSSVATVPTLLDQIRKGTSIEKHEINKGDLILLASVGAGMNVNAIAYRY